MISNLFERDFMTNWLRNLSESWFVLKSLKIIEMTFTDAIQDFILIIEITEFFYISVMLKIINDSDYKDKYLTLMY